MKALFVGDVHNHLYMFKDIERLDKEYKFDRIIFLGDYVDDWLTDNHNSLETLNTLFKLKEKGPDKYTMLIGNHELSYLGFPCSGHHKELEDLVEQKLKENIYNLEYYTEIELDGKTFVCSHAGFTNDYICQVLDVYGDWKPVLDELQKNRLQNLAYLRYCSRARGGMDSCSSFVWTDRMEHLRLAQNEKPVIPYQIAGHTPVTTVAFHSAENSEMYFVDTHSTYRSGEPYGDKSYLIYDKGFKIVY